MNNFKFNLLFSLLGQFFIIDRGPDLYFLTFGTTWPGKMCYISFESIDSQLSNDVLHTFQMSSFL